MKERIVAVMPIKMNNERCPGKNTRLLGGKPLLRHELDSLLETGLIDNICVYCSSEQIKDFLPSGITFVRRPQYLDLPSSNFNQIFSSFMAEVDADIYVYAHATAPFITVDTMRECIDAVCSGQYDSAFCAQKIQTFLWQNGKPLNFDSSNLPRTQDLEPVFMETSGIYVFRKSVFTNLKRRIGNNPFIKCVSYKEAVDIDNPDDFARAESMVNK